MIIYAYILINQVHTNIIYLYVHKDHKKSHNKESTAKAVVSLFLRN